jgi:hypothetical protein
MGREAVWHSGEYKTIKKQRYLLDSWKELVQQSKHWVRLAADRHTSQVGDNTSVLVLFIINGL